MSGRRRQAGLSIVELIIGMAVTSLILTGIVGIVFGVNNSYTRWVDRIAHASIGDVLAEAIQADSHRLIPCSGTTAELDFCQVDGSGPAVTYRTLGQDVIRSGGGRSEVVVRGLSSGPTYKIYCHAASGAGSGYIEVDGITGIGALRVYYHRPLGQC